MVPMRMHIAISLNYEPSARVVSIYPFGTTFLRRNLPVAPGVVNANRIFRIVCDDQIEANEPILVSPVG